MMIHGFGLRKYCLALAFIVSAITMMEAAPVPEGASDVQLKEKLFGLNKLGSEQAIRKSTADLMKQKDEFKRLVKLAAKEQKAAGDKEAPLKYNVSFVLGNAAQIIKDYESAEALYSACVENATKIKSATKISQAYSALIELNWDQKKFESVEEIARKFLDTRGEKGGLDEVSLGVLETLAKAKAKQGDTGEALKILDGLIQLPEIGWSFLQTKGWVYREANKIPDAIGSYEEYLTKIEGLAKGDPEKIKLVTKGTKYLLTGLYVDNKQIDKAADTLKALLKDDPDNATFHNDLGFIWADHGKNFEESEKLVRRALELDAKLRKKLLEKGDITEEIANQENGAYLDSLGWVLFKMKKYKDALPYLQKAAKDEEEGQHIEIWDHLADCLVALGQEKEALATWEKALTFEDVSKRDIERRKKIAEKVKAVKAKAEKK